MCGRGAASGALGQLRAFFFSCTRPSPHGRLPRPCLSLCTAHGPQPTVSSRAACAERRRSRKSAHAIMTEAREPHVEWVDGFLSHAGQSERERKPRRRRRSGMDSREPGPWALGALSLTELSRSRGQRPEGFKLDSLALARRHRASRSRSRRCDDKV